MMKKYIILSSGSDYDSFLVFAPWGMQEIQKIRNRYKKVHQFSCQVEDFVESCFHIDLEVYEQSSELEDWLENQPKEDLILRPRTSTLNRTSTLSSIPVVSGISQFGKSERQRISFSHINIGVSGSFYYTFGIKHSNEPFEAYVDFRIEDL